MKRRCLTHCAVVACSYVAAFVAATVFSLTAQSQTSDGLRTAAQQRGADEDSPARSEKPTAADKPSTDKPSTTDKQSAKARQSDTVDKKDSATDKQTTPSKDRAANSREQKFVRTLPGDKGKPAVLQTAIVTYKASSGTYAGVQVDLIGAIHIAD